MISYYNSKYPGIIAYLSLVTLSILYFSFAPLQNWSLGLLAMAWGFYTFMRALSLFEVSENPAPLKPTRAGLPATLTLPSSLPHDLMTRMNGRENLQRANMALSALSVRSLGWIALALVYCLCEIYISLHGLSANPLALPLEQKIAVFFIIGASFWAGQTYASNAFIAPIMLLGFAFVLALYVITGKLALIVMPITEITITALNPALLLALPLFAYSLFMLIPPLFKGKDFALNAAAGIAVLCVMIFMLILLPKSMATIALLIAGWSLFSLYWVRSTHMLRKTYRLQV